MKRLRLDCHAARQPAAVQRGRRMHAGVYVRRSGHNLNGISVLAAVYLADEQMRAFHLFTAEHFADHYPGDLFPQIGQLLHLKTASEELVYQLLGGYVNIHIFLQPTVRNFHLYSPHHSLNCFRKRRSFSNSRPMLLIPYFSFPAHGDVPRRRPALRSIRYACTGSSPFRRIRNSSHPPPRSAR